MLTLRQTIAARLRAVREEYRVRLDKGLREHYAREATREWWADLTDAAWTGQPIPAAVWRSAEQTAPDDVARLRVRWNTAKK